MFGALMFCLPERRIWGGLASAVAFMGAQWVLPRCRFRTDHYLGPANIALALMLLRLVVIPALIMLTGAESRVLSYLPSVGSMQQAVLIDTVAYVALCVGLSWGQAAPLSGPLAGPGPGTELTVIYLTLGVTGFLAAFGSPGRIVEYFMESRGQFQEEADGTFVALAGTFLRPFLAFGLVGWWSKQVDSGPVRKRLWWLTLAGLFVAVSVMFANLTFSFNRAAFVFPLVSLFVIYSARVRRIPVGIAAMGVLTAVPILMALETVRSNRMIGAETDVNLALERVLKDVSETVQGYGGGPQYSALLYERVGWGDKLYGGATLLASVLSPVPILGKGFRDTSGPAIFNRTLYDTGDVEDQIIPFTSELFINFHLAGVMFGFVGLGLLLAAAQQWLNEAGSTFAAFSIQYVGMWMAMLAAWSISIFSQIAIYFFGPIYFFIAAVKLVAWLRTEGSRASGVAV
jgi:hypothetical protein